MKSTIKRKIPKSKLNVIPFRTMKNANIQSLITVQFVPNLKILDISGNPLTSFEGLPELPQLHTLIAHHTGITTFKGCRFLPALSRLEIKSSPINRVPEFELMCLISLNFNTKNINSTLISSAKRRQCLKIMKTAFPYLSQGYLIHTVDPLVVHLPNSKQAILVDTAPEDMKENTEQIVKNNEHILEMRRRINELKGLVAKENRDILDYHITPQESRRKTSPKKEIRPRKGAPSPIFNKKSPRKEAPPQTPKQENTQQENIQPEINQNQSSGSETLSSSEFNTPKQTTDQNEISNFNQVNNQSSSDGVTPSKEKSTNEKKEATSRPSINEQSVTCQQVTDELKMNENNQNQIYQNENDTQSNIDEEQFEFDQNEHNHEYNQEEEEEMYENIEGAQNHEDKIIEYNYFIHEEEEEVIRIRHTFTLENKDSQQDDFDNFNGNLLDQTDENQNQAMTLSPIPQRDESSASKDDFLLDNSFSSGSEISKKNGSKENLNSIENVNEKSCTDKMGTDNLTRGPRPPVPGNIKPLKIGKIRKPTTPKNMKGFGIQRSNSIDQELEAIKNIEITNCVNNSGFFHPENDRDYENLSEIVYQTNLGGGPSQDDLLDADL